MNVLLVYPRGPETFWSFRHVLKFVSKKAAFPPLGLLTVAALLPQQWNFKLVDLNVAELSDEVLHWADYVLLSGMIVHRKSAHEVAARCVQHEKTVIAGGPLFTTGFREFPEIRHFVLGEAEDVIGNLRPTWSKERCKRSIVGAVGPTYARLRYRVGTSFGYTIT